MKIIPPDASIPPELARFSGKWYGRWGGVMDHILVVERIVSSKEIHVIYAWGAYRAWDIHNDGWRRTIGEFKNDKLLLKLERISPYYKYDKKALEATINFPWPQNAIMTRW